MLDTLLAAEERGEIDNEGIREEVDTFTFEGHDTTSAGLTFSFLLIALHPTIQTRVFEEIREIVGGRDLADLEPTDFNEMKYLDRVIKECLRIYPPVPFISRELSEDLMTEKGLVPKGAQIHLHIYDLHRDPEQFPDPEQFDPDRFLPENCEKRHPYAYVPFSAGPRNCIGQKFAMLELKTIMSSVLLKFKLKPITQREDIVFIADLVLRSRNPIKIKFEAR
jgi:cytochrome P450 family 4